MSRNQVWPALLLFLGSWQSPVVAWEELEKGLNYASIQLPIQSSHGDSKINVLRIDPSYFKFELLCAEERDAYGRSVKLWSTQFDLVAAVNASMFKLDGQHRTSTGLMMNYRYINNPTLTPSYKSVFAFNAVDSTRRDRLLDLTCDDWSQEKTRYNSFTQSLRMMDCHGNATWAKNEKKWSMVVLGEDLDGNILFIFVRSPYRVAEYITLLKNLPLRLKSLMYLEGGPEASLYVHHPKLNLERFGSYETGFYENDNNNRFWDVPNVIGIKRR